MYPYPATPNYTIIAMTVKRTKRLDWNFVHLEFREVCEESVERCHRDRLCTISIGTDLDSAW